MVVDRTDKLTLRIGRLEFTRLGWAFALSLAAHLLFWGSYAVVKHFDLAARLHLPAWVQRLVTPPPVEAKTPPPEREPYMFVDVREEQSVVEPPKNAIRYSDRNAVATNPDANQQTNEPKIEGEKNDLQKTDEAGRNTKLDQPKPEPPNSEAEPTSEVKPPPGVMTVAKVELKPQPEHQRPRTLREVRMRNEALPGNRSQQDGGAPKRGEVSYDVKLTGFGNYDRMFIDAVRTRWFDLQSQLSSDAYKEGKVVLRFNMNYKGEVSDVTLLENTVTDTLDLICRKAILDPSPYREWTREMRLALGDNRSFLVTFHY